MKSAVNKESLDNRWLCLTLAWLVKDREVGMPTYGLLHTSRDGRLIARRRIDCASDDDAIRAARALLSPDGEVAVFQDTRRVETVIDGRTISNAAD